MQFKYKAKNKEGDAIKGIIEAADEKSASSSLKEKGYFVTDLKSIRTAGLIKKLNQKKVSIKDKIIFTEQLGIMIKSGLSIVSALEALQEETQNSHFSSQIQRIIMDVKGGSPLSKALEKHPDTFSEIYVSMIKSGEESGKVDLVLKRLSTQLEKDYELKRKIKGALTYPAFILFALLAVTILILTTIIPQLKLVFEDAGVDLPVLTQIIISLSEFLKQYILYLIILAVIFAVIVFQFKKTPSGVRFFDSIILKIPVFGTLYRKTYMARFTRTFASLTASGLPLVDVFRVTGDTIGNYYYQKEIENMSELIKSGQPISKTLKESEYFPKMIGQLATVGEKSGNLDEVFETMADFFDRDVDNITSNLSTMLEPVLMIFLGLGIGLIIVSVLQPIYGLVNAI